MAATPRVPSPWSCAIALALVTLSLRVAGLRRSLALVRHLSRGTARGGSDEAARGAIHAVASRLATAAALFPGRALCLEQSLTLYYCLRRLGVPADLRLGVQPYPFAAHAWVEYRGVPVNENEERVRHFARLPEVAT